MCIEKLSSKKSEEMESNTMDPRFLWRAWKESESHCGQLSIFDYVHDEGSFSIDVERLNEVMLYLLK